MNLEDRYTRNYKSILKEEQTQLDSSTVALVGCGGLGGYMAEEFARLGVGHLILIDSDRFEVSNLNRQLMCTEENLGQWKVEATQERLKAVNSAVRITIYNENFEESLGDRMFQDVDLVCDALDTITDRLALERACHKMNIPLVFASIGGWSGMVGVSLPGDFSLAKLFGRNGQTDRGIEMIWGNPVFTPAVMASLSVAEATKILLKRPLSLRENWLFVDLLTMEFEHIPVMVKGE